MRRKDERERQNGRQRKLYASHTMRFTWKVVPLQKLQADFLHLIGWKLDGSLFPKPITGKVGEFFLDPEY